MRSIVAALISPRVARDVYQVVLREPKPADWLSDPLEALAALTTPHVSAIENWFDASEPSNEKENQADR